MPDPMYATPEEALTFCVDQLIDGDLPLEACVAQFPEHRTELMQLLPVALLLQQAGEVVPRPAYRQQARSRMEARLARSGRRPVVTTAPAPSRAVTPAAALAAFLQRLFQPATLRYAAVALLVIVFLVAGSLLSVNTVDAAAPGEALYRADLAMEQARLQLTRSDEAEISLRLGFADERLVEAQKLIRKGDQQNLQVALIAYSTQMAEIMKHTEQETQAADLLAQVDQKIVAQERELDTVFSLSAGTVAAFCDEDEALVEADGARHPLAASLAAQYGKSYEEVMDQVCGGVSFGQMMLALATGEENDLPVETVLSLRAGGLGWGRIWKQLGAGEIPEIDEPPGQENRPDEPSGQENRPETPPGQENRPERPENDIPPGQENRPETPPGQENRPESPPGLEDKPETPPGLEDKDEVKDTPPGLEDKPDKETPPGLEDKDK